MSSPLMLTGQRFGRLVAEKDVDHNRYGRVWLCRCDCGIETRAPAAALKRGAVKSCGTCGRANRFPRKTLIAQRVSCRNRGSTPGLSASQRAQKFFLESLEYMGLDLDPYLTGWIDVPEPNTPELNEVVDEGAVARLDAWARAQREAREKANANWRHARVQLLEEEERRRRQLQKEQEREKMRPLSRSQKRSRRLKARFKHALGLSREYRRLLRARKDEADIEAARQAIIDHTKS